MANSWLSIVCFAIASNSNKLIPGLVAAIKADLVSFQIAAAFFISSISWVD